MQIVSFNASHGVQVNNTNCSECKYVQQCVEKYGIQSPPTCTRNAARAIALLRLTVIGIQEAIPSRLKTFASACERDGHDYDYIYSKSKSEHSAIIYDVSELGSAEKLKIPNFHVGEEGRAAVAAYFADVELLALNVHFGLTEMPAK